MRVLIAGASGFLGTAFAQALTDQGHEVTRLVRREPTAPEEVRWEPRAGDLDVSAVHEADVVVNLAGAPNLRIPWTQSYARAFKASRIDTTRLLAEAVASAPGARPALLAQSGVAGYGDRGAEVITEDTPIDADTFMAEVTRDWEAATAPAVEAGARVVLLRTGVVLDRRGGALKTMLLPFRLGLGAQFSTGRQYFPTVTLDDWLAAVTLLATDDRFSGPYNIVAPDPATNAEFTRALGAALHRPTVLRVPAFGLRKVAGPIGGEVLASSRIEPRRLLEAGFTFAHPTIEDQVSAALA